MLDFINKYSHLLSQIIIDNDVFDLSEDGAKVERDLLFGGYSAVVGFLYTENGVIETSRPKW